MTKTLTIKLTDADAGTWSCEMPGMSRAYIHNVRIPTNQDYWMVAEALEPHIKNMYGHHTDAVIDCVDPNATDIGGEPTGGPVCRFRIIDGQVSAQV